MMPLLGRSPRWRRGQSSSEDFGLTLAQGLLQVHQNLVSWGGVHFSCKQKITCLGFELQVLPSKYLLQPGVVDLCPGNLADQKPSLRKVPRTYTYVPWRYRPGPRGRRARGGGRGR